jgi:hypothetical protein
MDNKTIDRCARNLKCLLRKILPTAYKTNTHVRLQGVTTFSSAIGVENFLETGSSGMFL